MGCLSSLISFIWSRDGYFHEEVRQAEELAGQRRQGTYVIPVLLAAVTVPPELNKYRWVDYYKKDGQDVLIQSLHRVLTPGTIPEATPEALVHACAGRECVLYVGAGFSALMGMPLWGSLVRSLLDWARSKNLVQSPLSESLEQSLESDADLVADHVYDAARMRGAWRT